MAVLFFVNYRPEVAREGKDWVYRYGQLEGRSEDPLDARQKLKRAVYADPSGILENISYAVGAGEGILPLLLDYDVLPIRGTNESALLRIDYGLTQNGSVWICGGVGPYRTYGLDPLEVKQSLVGRIYRTAQQRVDQDGLAALIADPIKAGVTNARIIDPSEGKIEDHIGGIAAKVVNISLLKSTEPSIQ